MNIKSIYAVLALFAIILTASYLMYSPGQEEKARQLGQQYVVKVRTELGKALKTSIRDEGVVGAVEFCSREAANITDEATMMMNERVTVRRYTDQPRNPQNKAGEYEESAITYFRSTVEPRGHYIQKVQSEQKTAFFNYYEPIMVQSMCVSCHGAKSQLSDEVKAILKERYPYDQATGYKAGDLRGVFKARIPAELVR